MLLQCAQQQSRFTVQVLLFFRLDKKACPENQQCGDCVGYFHICLHSCLPGCLCMVLLQVGPVVLLA